MNYVTHLKNTSLRFYQLSRNELEDFIWFFFSLLISLCNCGPITHTQCNDKEKSFKGDSKVLVN